MPLKIVRRKGSASYYIRGTVRGKTVFESCGTGDKAQAEGFLIKRQSDLYQRSVHGASAVITFTEAAQSYLASEERAGTTRRNVLRLTDHFRQILLHKIGQTELDVAYRKLLGPDVTGATKARHVRTPLVAVLEHAARRGWCARPAFETPAIAKVRTEYRTPAQVDALIRGASSHVQPLFTFLAGTGARPSEAFELDWRCVDLRGARCVVEQKQGDDRYIDLPPRVVAALAALPHREGAVFRSERPAYALGGGIMRLGPPYRTGEEDSSQARTAFATATRRAEWPGHWRVWTPKGQDKPKRQWVSDIPLYALRHSWASWHYCVHKDLLKLEKDGGWSTIEMVTRYAKAMPDAYRDEILTWFAGAPAEVRREA